MGWAPLTFDVFGTVTYTTTTDTAQSSNER